MLMSSLTLETLRTSLKNNLPLHIILESEINKMPFGTITINFNVLDGQIQMETLNLVKNKRTNYNLK